MAESRLRYGISEAARGRVETLVSLKLALLMEREDLARCGPVRDGSGREIKLHEWRRMLANGKEAERPVARKYQMSLLEAMADVAGRKGEVSIALKGEVHTVPIRRQEELDRVQQALLETQIAGARLELDFCRTQNLLKHRLEKERAAVFA